MTKYTGGQIWAACKTAGFPDTTTNGEPYSQAQIMAAVALAESGGDTAATAHTDKEYSVGVFQINLLVHTGITEATARTLEGGAAFAYQLYKGKGGAFTDWTMYKNGEYRKFLPIPGTPTAAPPPAVSAGDSPPSTHPTVDIFGQTFAFPTGQEWRDAGTAVGIGLLALLLIGASVWGFANGRG